MRKKILIAVLLLLSFLFICQISSSEEETTSNSFEANSIENIKIDASNLTVSIIEQTESTNISYEYTAPTNDTNYPVIYVEGTTLYIEEYDANGFFPDQSLNEELLIYVPTDFNFKDISVFCDNCSFKMYGINTDKLTIVSDSMNLNLDSVNANESNFDINSGSIGISASNLQQMIITGTNTSVDIINSYIGDADVLVRNTNVKLENTTFTKLNIENKFGKVELILPQNGSYEFSGDPEVLPEEHITEDVAISEIVFVGTFKDISVSYK